MCRIVLPTVLFAIIIYFPKKILRGDSITILSFLKETILGGSMWFTCALAVAEIMILILLLSRQRNLLFYLFASIVFTGIALWIKSTGFEVLSSDTLPWFYKGGMIATLFLVIGGLYNRYENRIDGILGKLPITVCLLALYACTVLFEPNYVKISLQSATITFPGLLASLVSIYVFIFFAKKLKPEVIIDRLGRLSLGIYLLSGGIPNVLAVIFSKYGFPSVSINVLSVTILSFLIGTTVVCLLNSICPFVFNFRLLKRSGK